MNENFYHLRFFKRNLLFLNGIYSHLNEFQRKYQNMLIFILI